MPKLIIDQRPIEVPVGTKVIAAAEKLGIMIPRFCYHPGLGSFGACRMCAVKFLEGPVKGVEMSCMTDAQDGMVVSTTDPEAVEFRKYVIEWLMMHHPLDCPVCDEGGHCLLQDETVSGGHGLRRYLGPKRTYQDQYLGLFVQHEMNRCIQCWRCRNFYQEFAGYRDYGAMQIGNRTYFGRFAPGPLESPFAGNIIDLCPTGVLTDKPSRFKGRRWHYERGPSLCIHCSLGCNLTASAYLRELMRLEARENDAVNGYFICDRGRYGFFYANLAARPRRARVDGQEVPRDEGIKAAAEKLAQIRQKYGSGAIACWGSTRSSLETQAALLRFCRTQGLPDPQFFATPAQERRVKATVARLDARLAVSLRQLEDADFLLAVGADPVHEAPMLALALRQAHRRGATVAVLDPRPVSLPLTFTHLALPPREINATLNVLLKGACGPEEEAALSGAARQFFEALPSQYPDDPAIAAQLQKLSDKLRRSRKPVLICGTEIVRETTPHLAADHALLLKALGKDAGLFYLLPGANAFGAALMAGLPAPAAAPGAESPSAPSRSPAQLVAAMEQGDVKALLLVENDPFWSFPDEDKLSRALKKLELLLVLDYLPSPAVPRAQVVLPTLTLFEGAPSHFVNQEGRLQLAPPVHAGGTPIALISPEQHPPRTFLNYIPGGDPQPPAEIFADLAQALSGGQERQEIWAWLREQNPLFDLVESLAEHPEGVRLLSEVQGEYDFSRATLPPEAPGAAPLELLLVDWTFGTEELAAYSPCLQQTEEAPGLFMNPQDAARLGLAAGDQVALQLPGGALAVELKVAAAVAPGVLILPRHRQLQWRKLPEAPLAVADSQIVKVQG